MPDQGMVTLTKKARKPKDMAKAALRESAKSAIAGAGLPASGKCVVTIGDFVQEYELTPTAGLKDGRIMYHAGGRGNVDSRVGTLSHTFGANWLIDRAVSDHAAILSRYGVKVEVQENLEEGETTV